MTVWNRARLAAAALVFWCGANASAQISTGQIIGTVVGAEGQPIQGATIVAVRNESGPARQAVSNSAGFFIVAGLSPGTYRIDIVLAGFQRLQREGIRVETGGTARLDLELAMDGVAETLIVTADAPLQRATASLGQVISQEKVAALPLNGRSFISLASLAPGVALPPASQLPRINGGRPRTNEYLFDGISVLQPEPGQIAYFPSIDAIQEFRVETNSPPAEFGRFNGGVINLTTKAGSNVFHGTGFGFLRHQALNARNFFATLDATKPEFRRNQFGGVLGGPVLRDRTFFFADYLGQRQTIGRTMISTVPTTLQRQGVFSEPIAGRVPVIYDPASGTTARAPFAANTIPYQRIDPVALALLQRYPLPTAAGTANNYRRTAPERDNQDQWTWRLDQRWNTGRDQAFARLTRFHGRFAPVTPLPDGSGATSGVLGPQQTTSWAFASNYQRTLSANLYNELRIGDTRRSVDRRATQLGLAAGVVLNLPGIPPFARFSNTLPTFLISGYQHLGSPPNTAAEFGTSVTQLADTLTWIRGRHSIRMGLDWRWQRLNVIQPPSPTGAFTFNSLGSDLPGTFDTGTPLASFLLGEVQSFAIDLQQETIQQRARSQEYFVQDDWRLGDRLTISPGVRYTLNFPSREINGQTAVLNLETRLLEYPGDRPVRQLKRNNFGPRLGIAYRATDRTTASAGYGLVWIEMTGITTPFTTPSFPFLQTVSLRALDTLSPAFLLRDGPSVPPLAPTPTAGLGQGVFSVNRALGSGYVQQWNASVQRQLAADINIELAYVGSTITNVGIPDTNLNQLSVQQLARGPELLQRVPNPFFGIISRSSPLGDPTVPLAQLLKPYPEYTAVSLYRNNVGTTSYHGVTAKVERRFSRGLSFLVSYTRSRLMDDASSVFDASVLTGPVVNYPVADSFDRARERDYSTGDIPHVLVASGVWDLPWGGERSRRLPGLAGWLGSDWSLAAIVTLQSGVPVAVTQATNFNAFAGFGTQRPNLVGNPELPAADRTPSRWFDTSAFAVAPQFTLGTASRNPIRGPGYRNVDVSLSRKVPIRRGHVLELRAEMFNALNTPPLGNPNGVLGSAGFGAITTAGDPRVAQLGLKWRF
jgi:hypothetical protein